MIRKTQGLFGTQEEQKQQLTVLMERKHKLLEGLNRLEILLKENNLTVLQLDLKKENLSEMLSAQLRQSRQKKDQLEQTLVACCELLSNQTKK
mmetsp:Transcript_7547/g.11423  ORF Transcript_7547/g.11423 Transcript_7547/m.11423 type:complete len:93 (+) Transcript_7547:2-280(+)